MAREVKQTYIVTDDIDGKELPEDTQPTIFGWNNKQYEIYLSDSNHEELDKFLTKYVDNSVEKRNVSASFAAAPANFFKEVGFERAELEEIWQKMQENDQKGTADIEMGPSRLSNNFKNYVKENISKYK